MNPQSSRVRSPADVGGPSTSPPPLPEGWLAQWEGTLRKWYFVQPATGKSQWEVPTEPFIPTPSSTPHSIASPGPYHAPRAASLAPSETEAASREFQELRSGKWPGSGSFSNNSFGSMQPSPYQQVSTPGSQRTPTLSGTPTMSDQMQSSRPSSQGILGQVASDLASRTNNDEMVDVQQTNTPNQYTCPPSYSQVQGTSNQVQDVTMGQETSQLQNENTGAGTSFTPQQSQAPAYATPDHGQIPQGAPIPSSMPGTAPIAQSHGESQPAMVQPISSAPMEPGAQYQYFPGQTPPAQQGMIPYPTQPHQQPDPYYQKGPIPVPPGQFPSRIAPGSQPKDNGITVIHPDPNAAPLFPTRYSDAERRRQQAGMQSGYNSRTPPGQAYQVPAGGGYTQNTAPNQGGYSQYDQYAPRSGQRQPSQGSGPPWDYDRSQPEPQGGYPVHARYTPPQQHQHQPQPQAQHYRADSGGYPGGWGR
ncbi:hypothetical protein D8B26_006471 [Coccidioides posadasii str. Silveira]|uniref:Uncharacterized protein n=1 Tax=Coccidioides posadasii (strain RMSCC 757 / Silveira) TaxID=443226 RepID=E9CTA0_COCPS|nr:conserved hypothetical protein [Coccidioides posadasii str. Silveira]QVM11826.1 hypothetical protein D8B26_006471 [Coccidioides posadasii str. Silveira]